MVLDDGGGGGERGNETETS